MQDLDEREDRLVPLGEPLFERVVPAQALGQLNPNEERVRLEDVHQPLRQLAEAAHDVEELRRGSSGGL